MDRKDLALVDGARSVDTPAQPWPGAVRAAINSAIHAGYRIGRSVCIGHVSGQVVGYNIGSYGPFSGASYPLLVRTPFGVAKCSQRECSLGNSAAA